MPRTCLTLTFHPCPSSGLVTQLEPEFYAFISELQQQLTRVIRPVGKIEHSAWRAYRCERKTEPCEGFIDGDLIESFLDLNREQMAEVVKDLMVRPKREGRS